MASQPIYQFYAELKDYEPKIWRRFQVPEYSRRGRVGGFLMAMYEMKANDLVCVTVPIRDNVKLDETLSGVGSVFPDKSWRFEIGNEELFPGEGPLAPDLRLHPAAPAPDQGGAAAPLAFGKRLYGNFIRRPHKLHGKRRRAA